MSSGTVEYQSFLRFDVAGLGSRPVISAILRLYVTDPSVDGESVFLPQNDWEENTVTYATSPEALGGVLDRAGPVSSSAEGSVPPELVVHLGSPVAPTADSTASVLAGTAPPSVDFTDTSLGGPVIWDWSFGDGGASQTEDPIHIYMAPGTYTVTLTAVSAGAGTR